MGMADLGWKEFSSQYKLKNDRYLRDVRIIEDIQDNDNYPIILFPENINKQTKKRFIRGGKLQHLDKGNSIWMEDILSIAKTLRLPDNEWKYLVHPYCPNEPRKKETPYGYNKKTTSVNWGCLSLLIIFFGFVFLCTFYPVIKEGIEISAGFGLLILWIPVIIIVLKPENTKELTNKNIKYKIHSASKIQKMKLENEILYNQQLRQYDLKIREYEKKLAKFELDSEAQSGLLDFYAEDIVVYIWNSCMKGNKMLEMVPNPPQKGRLEDTLFFELMKIYPEYVRIDIKAGYYYPDITICIVNRYFIDIEIDEPYEYQSKKETHYILCGDENRNSFFTENNWFVLRFAEEQLIHNLDTCVLIITNIIEFIRTGKTKYLREVSNIKDNIRLKRWTKEEARFLALSNSRDNTSNWADPDDLPF